MIRRTAFRLAMTFASVLVAAPALRAEPQVTQLRPGVKYVYAEQKNPQNRLHAVVIDVKKSGAVIDVAGGGEDPDGEGPWTTVLQPAPLIAENEGFDITINGDFFSTATRPYRAGVHATVSGPAMSDGKLWVRSKDPRPSLLINDKGQAAIAVVSEPPAGEKVEEIIAGSDVLIDDGKDVAKGEGSFAGARHPRTAVGVADGGNTLILLVVDGRQEGKSVGMTLPELSKAMKELGADDAINLDGGGSTTLVFRNTKAGTFEIINKPSDGKPRAIANALGVTFKNGQGTDGRKQEKKTQTRPAKE